MQNMKKLLTVLLMLATVVFISCDKDDDDGPLTANEAKEELADLGDQMEGMVADMSESDGLGVFMYMNTLPDPFDAVPTKSAGKAELFSKIEKYLLPTTILDSKVIEPNFDFEYYKGIYTYVDAPVPYFEWVDDPNIIQINFPSSETSATNDAQLTIYNYHETFIDDGYGGYYNPDLISADIKVNGVKYLGLEMDATWVNDGPPSELYVEAFIKPFSFMVDFDFGTTSASVDAWIKIDGTTIFSAGVDAEFETTTEEPPTVISGYIQLYDVKFKATVNFIDLMTAMEAINETSTIDDMNSAINDNITAKVYVGGNFAAEILADFSTTEGAGFPIDEGIYLDILFEFSDGSTTSAIPYFASFAEELMTFFGALEDYFDGEEEISK